MKEHSLYAAEVSVRILDAFLRWVRTAQRLLSESDEDRSDHLKF